MKIHPNARSRLKAPGPTNRWAYGAIHGSSAERTAALGRLGRSLQLQKAVIQPARAASSIRTMPPSITTLILESAQDYERAF